MARLRPLPTQEHRPTTETVPAKPYGFRPGHVKIPGSGRPRGKGNLISADTRREILAGIAAHGSDGRGAGGVAGAVYRAVADNPRNAVSLLCAICPREVTADIRRTEVSITTIADLDTQLRAMGLPGTRINCFPAPYSKLISREATQSPRPRSWNPRPSRRYQSKVFRYYRIG